jgi:hypothetical protein
MRSHAQKHRSQNLGSAIRPRFVAEILICSLINDLALDRPECCTCLRKQAPGRRRACPVLIE